MYKIEDIRNKIIRGDALEVLKQMPSESINTIVTSPPYWGLRDYGKATYKIWGGDPDCEHEWGETVPRKYHKSGETNAGKEGYTKDVGAWGEDSGRFCRKCGAWYGQLGLEPTLDMYLDHLLQITSELKRVLRKDGVMFWVHGDSYGGSGAGTWKNPPERIESKEVYRMPYGSNPRKRSRTASVKPKSLAMQNYRLAMRMVDEQGWILRNILIWCLSGDTKVFVKRENVFKHITIKEMQEGDEVFTIDMQNIIRKVKVKHKIYNGMRRAYKIITKSGREIIATAEHIFPIKASYFYGDYIKLHFKKVKELSTRDFLWINYNLPILPMGNNEDYEKGFVVGFFIAEGTYIKELRGEYKDSKYSQYAQRRWGRVSKPYYAYYGIQLACGKKDIERGYLKYFSGYDIQIKNYKGNAISVYSRDRDLLSLIKKYVIGEHASGKHLSEEVWNTTMTFLMGVVDGFLAGDGHHDLKNDRWRVGITVNKQLKDDLMLACRLIGYEFRYEGIRKTNYETQAMYFVVRKHIKRANYKGMLYADQIEKIEDVGLRDVYDIEVEPIYTSYCGKGITSKVTKEERKARWNSLYFLSNGVWTHNSKPNGMPSSVKDRFANKYEPVFMFVKNKKYWFDLDAVKVPYKNAEEWEYRKKIRKGKHYGGKGTPQNTIVSKTKIPEKDAEKYGSPRARVYRKNKYVKEQENAKNPGDVWSISTQPFPEAHFSTFPERLIEPMIKSGCPKWICKKCGKPRMRITEVKIKNYRYDRGEHSKQFGIKQDVNYKRYTVGWTDCGCNAGWRPGIVLDPFMGSGTTALVALKNGCDFIGIELNPDYIKMAEKRIAPYKGIKRLDEFGGI